MYKALAVINLPPDNRKEPGDLITKKELEEAGQTEEDIAKLIKQKAIGEKDDPIHKDYDVTWPEGNPDADHNVIASEDGKGGDSN